jgi:hypothetical protein
LVLGEDPAQPRSYRAATTWRLQRVGSINCQTLLRRLPVRADSRPRVRWRRQAAKLDQILEAA